MKRKFFITVSLELSEDYEIEAESEKQARQEALDRFDDSVYYADPEVSIELIEEEEEKSFIDDTSPMEGQICFADLAGK